MDEQDWGTPDVMTEDFVLVELKSAYDPNVNEQLALYAEAAAHDQ